MLDGKRIAIWGYGREGRAALVYLRSKLPEQRITVFCNAAEAAAIETQGDANVICRTVVDADALAEFEVVIKSPGISKYKAEALDAQARGTQLIGGTALWFAAHPKERTVCVSGTKGKSTVSSLIAHLLRSAGKKTALVGNIGMPLLETMAWQEMPDYWVIEMSSYQTFEAKQPDVAVLLNFFPEHLDWHGSEQAYIADKSALITQAQPKHAVLNAEIARVAALAADSASNVHWFNHADGWHAKGHRLYKGEDDVLDLRSLPMPGQHNAGNVCAALAAIDALGLDAKSLAPYVQSFQPLPHRLQNIGERGDVQFINDSISTTPFASIAALECFSHRKAAVLVGGYDRGLDWQAFADYVKQHPPSAIICMAQNGPRIHELLQKSGVGDKSQLTQAADMQQAVTQALQSLNGDGVVLLSPGAPSFGHYADYVERGRHFAEISGFDPNHISKIPGLGLG